MAIVWQHTVGERHYRVTRAGQSIRLYTNGVFHSQYNPARPVAGNLWDVLFLPALMHPRPLQLKRVLVLGVGGGAVIQQLQCFLQPAAIVGVDLDGIHLRVARRYFGVRQANVLLVHAEAQSWLQDYQGGPFDLIIEDLFRESATLTGAADPVRAIRADDAWLRLLHSRLSDDGVLVMNFESARSLRQSECKNWANKKGGFRAAYRLGCARYHNVIAALLRRPLSGGEFINNLRQFKSLDQRRKSCQLQFTWRKL